MTFLSLIMGAFWINVIDLTFLEICRDKDNVGDRLTVIKKYGFKRWKCTI